MSALRGAILTVADNRAFHRLVAGGLGRRVALRFVAGETLDDAMRVVKELTSSGFAVSLDYLGENVSSEAEAASATAMYAEAIDRIAAESLNANASVKLTQLGLDVDPKLAESNIEALAKRCDQHDTSITLDMEDHRYTERTIEACERLSASHPGRVGIAIQAYLYRSPADVERVIGSPVRLCKGAYKEAGDVAHPKKQDVDAAFASLTVRLLSDGAYPMIATHDERLINHAIRNASIIQREPSTFEFQMLYGIRRDLQRRLVEAGYRVRVYVPFGEQWYPYLVRRLAERPANMTFFVSGLVRK